jgi:hypothetical protein
VVDVSTEDKPLVLALVHSAQARPEKLPDWLDKMAGGRQQPGWADIVVSGHYRNFQLRSLNGNRAWLRAPRWTAGVTGTGTFTEQTCSAAS